MKRRKLEPGLWQVSVTGGFHSAIAMDEILESEQRFEFRYMGKSVLTSDDGDQLQGYRKVDYAECLVKLVQHKCWAEAHKKGMHFQRFKKYYETEADTPGGRFDKYDGGVALQHESISFSFWKQGAESDRVTINTAYNLAEPATIRYKNVDRLYMTCFTCVPVRLSPDGRVSGDIEPRLWDSFGNHAVILLKPQLFLNRLYNVLKAKDYHSLAGHVKYYDQPNVPDISKFEETVLAKRKEYAWQREFRIVVDPRIEGDLPDDIFVELDMNNVVGFLDHK